MRLRHPVKSPPNHSKSRNSSSSSLQKPGKPKQTSHRRATQPTTSSIGLINLSNSPHRHSHAELSSSLSHIPQSSQYPLLKYNTSPNKLSKHNKNGIYTSNQTGINKDNSSKRHYCNLSSNNDINDDINKQTRQNIHISHHDDDGFSSSASLSRSHYQSTHTKTLLYDTIPRYNTTETLLRQRTRTLPSLSSLLSLMPSSSSSSSQASSLSSQPSYTNVFHHTKPLPLTPPPPLKIQQRTLYSQRSQNYVNQQLTSVSLESQRDQVMRNRSSVNSFPTDNDGDKTNSSDEALGDPHHLLQPNLQQQQRPLSDMVTILRNRMAAKGEYPENEATFISAVRFCCSHMWDDWRTRGYVVSAFICLLLGKIFNVILPLIHRDAIDHISQGQPILTHLNGGSQDTEEAIVPPVKTLQTDFLSTWIQDTLSDLSFVSNDDWRALPIALLITYGTLHFLSVAFSEAKNNIFSRVVAQSVYSISTSLITRLMTLDKQFHTLRDTPSLCKAIDRGLHAVNILLSTLAFDFLPATVEVALICGLLTASVGPIFGGIAVSTVGAYLYYTQRIVKWRGKFRRALNKADNRVTRLEDDLLINYISAQRLSNVLYLQQAYGRLMSTFMLSYLRTVSSHTVLRLGQAFIFSIGLISALTYSVFAIGKHDLTLGEFVLIYGFFINLLNHIRNMSASYATLKQCVLDLQPTLALKNIYSTLYTPKNPIELRIQPPQRLTLAQNITAQPTAYDIYTRQHSLIIDYSHVPAFFRPLNYSLNRQNAQNGIALSNATGSATAAAQILQPSLDITSPDCNPDPVLTPADLFKPRPILGAPVGFKQGDLLLQASHISEDIHTKTVPDLISSNKIEMTQYTPFDSTNINEDNNRGIFSLSHLSARQASHKELVLHMLAKRDHTFLPRVLHDFHYQTMPYRFSDSIQAKDNSNIRSINYASYLAQKTYFPELIINTDDATDDNNTMKNTATNTATTTANNANTTTTTKPLTLNKNTTTITSFENEQLAQIVESPNITLAKSKSKVLSTSLPASSSTTSLLSSSQDNIDDIDLTNSEDPRIIAKKQSEGIVDDNNTHISNTQASSSTSLSQRQHRKKQPQYSDDEKTQYMDEEKDNTVTSVTNRNNVHLGSNGTIHHARNDQLYTGPLEGDDSAVPSVSTTSSSQEQQQHIRPNDPILSQSAPITAACDQVLHHNTDSQNSNSSPTTHTSTSKKNTTNNTIAERFGSIYIDRDNKKYLDVTDGIDFEFKNVKWTSPQTGHVIDIPQLSIPRKSKVALVGPPRGGKSQVLNLLARDADPMEGTVSMNGVDMKQIRIGDINGVIGTLEQDMKLFNASPFENVLLANRFASDEEVIEAMKLAELPSSMIPSRDILVGMQRELGRVTPIPSQTVGEKGGILVSSIQRQRIGFARALLQNPLALLCDDITSSSIDDNRKLYKNLFQFANGNYRVGNEIASHCGIVYPPIQKTLVMVTYSLPLVTECDIIYVMDNGIIVESGDHHKLLAKGGLYARLWDSQQDSIDRFGHIQLF